MKDLYKILQINKSSTSNDIKRAYKKMAFMHHPDKGGTEEKFKEISEAYEILIDDQKRKRYDLGGYDSVQQSGGGNPMDIFNDLFGGRGARMMGGMFNMSDMMSGNPFAEMMGHQQKANIRVEKIDVTLDDLYMGTKKTKIIETSIKCVDCSGNGYLKNGKQMCSACNGTKVIVQTMQMGPMIQQSRRPCHVCLQKGYTIIPGYECKSCNSTGTTKVKKKYNLNVNKGNVSGKDIQLKGKGDYIPELDVQGDLVIQLLEVPHKRFKRKNNDLFVEAPISVQDALCGTIYPLKYLNNTEIYLNIDKCIQPDYIMRVTGKGMPLLTETGILYGDLLVLFKIQFPMSISRELRSSLRDVFKIENIHSNKESLDIEYYKKINEMEEEQEGGVQCVHQ